MTVREMKNVCCPGIAVNHAEICPRETQTGEVCLLWKEAEELHPRCLRGCSPRVRDQRTCLSRKQGNRVPGRAKNVRAIRTYVRGWERLALRHLRDPQLPRKKNSTVILHSWSHYRRRSPPLYASVISSIRLQRPFKSSGPVCPGGEPVSDLRQWLKSSWTAV